MNAHTGRFNAIPPSALATLRAGMNLVAKPRLAEEMRRAGITHEFTRLLALELGCPDLTPGQFERYRKVLDSTGVWVLDDGAGQVGAVTFGHYHAGFHMTAARCLLGWTRADVVSLPDVRLDCEQLGWAEQRPDLEIVSHLEGVFSAAGVQFECSAGPQKSVFGVFASASTLDPAASRAALMRLRGQHDGEG